jgi:predicted MPP superfamily phosphohydrolase
MNSYGSTNAWIARRLSDDKIDLSEIYKLYDQFKKDTGSYCLLDSFKRQVRKIAEQLKADEFVPEIDPELTVKLEARKQGLQDSNNFLRKLNRENYRVYNVLEALFQEYIITIRGIEWAKFNIQEHKRTPGSRIGVLQLSDLHFNEYIDPKTANSNFFNFEVASKRLKKFVSESIPIFKQYDVKDLYIIFTGDLINSNRRLSEKMNQITSQVRASLLATQILTQLFIELGKHFNLHTSFVVGNESRLGEDVMDSSDLLSSENWDYSIFYNLYQIFRDKKVEFIHPQNNVKSILKLPNGFNILLMHGHLLKGQGASDKDIAMALQEYLYSGVPVHMVLSGHRHNASIGDLISRSSSLCGGNSYSSQDLGFLSRASQNIYIINPDMGYNGMKIDLQDVSKIDKGYLFQEDLETYQISSGLRSNQAIISKNLV